MQSESLQKIEHDAACGKPCPKNLRPPEAMLYYMLFGLYSAYHAGKISKEQGHDMKKQIYKVYNRMATEYKQFTDLCVEYQKRIREGYSAGGITVIQKEENANE